MKKTVAIIGGGASALLLGIELDSNKFDITIFEKNAALGRKFLVAGGGGLNITHSENLHTFKTKYTPPQFLESALNNFSNTDFINWMNELGIETYIGSSGRVFPKKGSKAIEVLNHFLNQIVNNKTKIYFKHTWKGFTPTEKLIFETENKTTEQKFDIVIFCLGGASWPVTGSSGDWLSNFTKKNINCHPFLASNCAFGVMLNNNIISKLEGKALKNCNIQCGDKKQLGEVVFTKFGIEGSGVYPFSPEIRKQLQKNNTATIYIDFKPQWSEANILQKLNASKIKTNYTQHIKTSLNLSEVQLLLLKGCLNKEDFLKKELLTKTIKHFELTINALASIEEAISTVGGIDLEEINTNFELKKMPNHFVIGEMLNYDAPTGGYLLQSCFSMAKNVSDYLNTT